MIISVTSCSVVLTKVAPKDLMRHENMNLIIVTYMHGFMAYINVLVELTKKTDDNELLHYGLYKSKDPWFFY